MNESAVVVLDCNGIDIANNAKLRDIIKNIKQAGKSIMDSVYTIGSCLAEAKKLVPHGQWDNWLKIEVGCSTETARKYIHVYNEFHGNTTINQLGVDELEKLYLLTTITPQDEREKYIATNKDIIKNASVRELKADVKNFKNPSKSQDNLRNELKLKPHKVSHECKKIPFPVPNKSEEDLKIEACIAKSNEKNGNYIVTNPDTTDHEYKTLTVVAAKSETEIRNLEIIHNGINDSITEINNCMSTIGRHSSYIEKMKEKINPKTQENMDKFKADMRNFLGVSESVPNQYQVHPQFKPLPPTATADEVNTFTVDILTIFKESVLECFNNLSEKECIRIQSTFNDTYAGINDLMTKIIDKK
jgi:hypothetical protein